MQSQTANVFQSPPPSVYLRTSLAVLKKNSLLIDWPVMLCPFSVGTVFELKTESLPDLPARVFE